MAHFRTVMSVFLCGGFSRSLYGQIAAYIDVVQIGENLNRRRWAALSLPKITFERRRDAALSTAQLLLKALRGPIIRLLN